jgi:hypothetical protein
MFPWRKEKEKLFLLMWRFPFLCVPLRVWEYTLGWPSPQSREGDPGLNNMVQMIFGKKIHKILHISSCKSMKSPLFLRFIDFFFVISLFLDPFATLQGFLGSFLKKLPHLDNKF